MSDSCRVGSAGARADHALWIACVVAHRSVARALAAAARS
jgi:hypothetical protein